MGFKQVNPNPCGSRVGDCVIRAVSILLGYDWERAYAELALQGFMMGDMPSANAVWGTYLKHKGYKQHLIPDEITVAQFADENPEGAFLLGTGSHVVTVIDSDYYDSWDSGDELPIYYFERG